MTLPKKPQRLVAWTYLKELNSPNAMISRIILLLFFICPINHMVAQDTTVPDTVSIKSGKLILKGLLWRPAGYAPFPAIIFSHGGYETSDTTYNVIQNASLLGRLFARNGYIFLVVFRRGTGLSKGQGKNAADLMAEALKQKGQEGRNKIQLQQLKTDQLQDMISGLTLLKNRKDVDKKRIAVVGHSFGGSLALLLAEHEIYLKAAVVFSAAGFSWERSPELREYLSTEVQHIKGTVMFVHARNDYSLKPGYALDSIMRRNNKPCLLKIYPAFGTSERDGHNLVFLNTDIWESDVLNFLNNILKPVNISLNGTKILNGYAEVNGTRLYYEVAGDGKPLVLIHGSFGDRHFWDFQFSELSKKYKVIRYDIRGYGKSALPDSNELYRDTDDLNALMDFLGIKKANICGLSLGSFIVIDFALSHPEKCISLIPVGPRVAGDGTDEYKTPSADSVRAVIAKTTDIVKSKGPKAATDYLWTGNHVMGKCIVSPETRQLMLKMGYDYSWWRYIYPSKREFVFPMAIKKLNEIRIPTLIMTAEYDLELCKEVASIMAKQIPGAKLVSIKGAGHIMNMDKPDEFNEAISQFIEEVK
jgi:pimeloyl-ACP methyl ester carboxylesterase